MIQKKWDIWHEQVVVKSNKQRLVTTTAQGERDIIGVPIKIQQDVVLIWILSSIATLFSQNSWEIYIVLLKSND